MCETEGADGLSLINTIQAMAIDIRERRAVLTEPTPDCRDRQLSR